MRHDFEGLEYKQDSFSTEIQLPDPETLMGKGRTIRDLPYNQLRLFVLSKMSTPPGETLAPGGLVVRLETKKKLDLLCIKWMEERHGMSTDAAEKYLENLDLAYGPSVMAKNEWSEPGVVYVKHEPFVPKPSCSGGCRGCG